MRDAGSADILWLTETTAITLLQQDTEEDAVLTNVRITWILSMSKRKGKAMKQLSIFDIPSVFPTASQPDHPLCYDCQYAVKRGEFRLCRKGWKGYRKIGKFFDCPDHETVGDCAEDGK